MILFPCAIFVGVLYLHGQEITVLHAVDFDKWQDLLILIVFLVVAGEINLTHADTSEHSQWDPYEIISCKALSYVEEKRTNLSPFSVKIWAVDLNPFQPC